MMGACGLKLPLLPGCRCGADARSNRSTNKSWGQQWPADYRANDESGSRTHAASCYSSLTPTITTGGDNEDEWNYDASPSPNHWQSSFKDLGYSYLLYNIKNAL